MSLIANIGTSKITDLLRGQGGLQANIAQLAATKRVAPIIVGAEQILARNVAPEIMERSTAFKYPAIHAYCEKTTNSLREKFRRFSGTADMVVEIRISSDRLEGLNAATDLLTDAVTEVLDENHGDWGDGVFFGGAYEIKFTPVRHGGKNFIQTAKISFQLEISRD